MKRTIKTIIIAATMALPFIPATAQHTYSGYFTDGYLYRHQMNPAFSNNKGYFAFPILGNMNMAFKGGLGLGDVLYNINGKTTTFMNPNVSTAEAMSNIKDQNKFGMDMKLQLLSFGFKGFKGYNTIGVNVRSNLGFMLPGEFFRLAKEGISNQSYLIEDMRMHADAYVELALGHSHQINENLSIGATMKFLVGGANIDAHFKQVQLSLGEDKWTATSEAEIQSSMKGMMYETEINENTGHQHVNGMDVENPGISGYGIAFDLGAAYQLKDWTFSASLLDLGFINWSNNIVASTNGVKTFNTSRYIFNVDDDQPNNFEDEMDRLTNDLSTLYELENNGDMGKRFKTLAATLNLGTEYTLPMYRKLSFGALNTTRFQGDFTWTEFRLSANWAPTKFFSLGVNGVTGTYGTGFGGIIKLGDIFLAMDRMVTNVTKQGVPVNANASFHIGANIAF